jgi:predicted nucleotidyltransferase component of viral defense system
VPKKSPQSHMSIKTRLNTEARKKGLNPSDMQNQFFREIFLTHVFSEDQGPWVLKGGTNLYCRIPGARHTRDIDLFSQDPTAAREAALELRQLMHQQRVGPYQFTLGEIQVGGDQIDVYSIKVTVLAGVESIATFNIDVSGDLQVPDVPRDVTFKRNDGIDLDGVPQSFLIRSYPISNQIADKVCAMYEIHGTRASTRYRDLYDLALIATHLSFDATETIQAFEQQEEVRQMNLPTSIQLPAPDWKEEYTRVMKKTPGAHSQFHATSDALTAASRALNPLLSKKILTGTWNFSQQSWIND